MTGYGVLGNGDTVELASGPSWTSVPKEDLPAGWVQQQWHHIESQMVAKMINSGTRDATVYLSGDYVCGYCTGVKLGISSPIRTMLPQGWSLTVFFRNGEGWRNTIFVGNSLSAG